MGGAPGAVQGREAQLRLAAALESYSTLAL